MFTLIYLERSNNELEREGRIYIYISLEYKNWRVKNWPTIIQESIFWLRFGTLVKNGCSEQSKQASLVITDEKTSIIETKLLSLEIVAHRSVKRRRRTKFLSPFLSRWLTRTPPPWKKEEGGAGGWRIARRPLAPVIGSLFHRRLYPLDDEICSYQHARRYIDRPDLSSSPSFLPALEES